MSLTQQQVEHKLGLARPDGDPKKMADTAIELGAIADGLLEQSRAMETTRLTGSGGLIERTNTRVDARKTRLKLGAGELRDLAATLTTRAGGLADAQADWDRKAAKVPGWRP